MLSNSGATKLVSRNQPYVILRKIRRVNTYATELVEKRHSGMVRTVRVLSVSMLVMMGAAVHAATIFDTTFIPAGRVTSASDSKAPGVPSASDSVAATGVDRYFSGDDTSVSLSSADSDSGRRILDNIDSPGPTSTSMASPATTPAPATILLSGLAAIAVGGLRRRRPEMTAIPNEGNWARRG